MAVCVRKGNLLVDGDLPRDSLLGGSHRYVFCEAKPLIDREFKVNRPNFILAWVFDRQIERVFDSGPMKLRPKRGKFYDIYTLRSQTDREVAHYLIELGWQVRLTVVSLQRQEFLCIAIFSAEGALLKEREEFFLKSLEAEEAFSDDYDEIVARENGRELALCFFGARE
jgi:hypothetical protein